MACHRSSSTTLASASRAVDDAIGERRPEVQCCSTARGGSGKSSALPTQTDIASRSLMRNSQCPRSPAVDTPVRRSAFLRVRAKDALVWGVARKAISKIVPWSEPKHVWSAQFLAAHICKIGTSFSRS